MRKEEAKAFLAFVEEMESPNISGQRGDRNCKGEMLGKDGGALVDDPSKLEAENTWNLGRELGLVANSSNASMVDKLVTLEVMGKSSKKAVSEYPRTGC
ncbi:hypothetical protein OROMI_012941 [Orobanche minor]